MKTIHSLFAGLLLAGATAAFAAGTEPVAAQAADTATAPQHQVTREEVQAQVIEARRNGTLIETEADMDVAQTRNQHAR